MGNSWPIIWSEGSGFLEITVMNFTGRILFDFLFTCRLRDDLLHFTNVFSLFHFIKSYINGIFIL